MDKEPIVMKLKRYVREKQVKHATIAELIGKHRTFVSRKLNGDSMETRLLEQIMDAVGIWYEDLVCKQEGATHDLAYELRHLRQEVNMIKESLPTYQKKNPS